MFIIGNLKEKYFYRYRRSIKAVIVLYYFVLYYIVFRNFVRELKLQMLGGRLMNIFPRY